MAFCRNCGLKLEEGVRFCTNCGAKDEGAAEQRANYGQRGAYSRPATAAEKNPLLYFAEIFTKKYAVFEGRARRAEFWWFTLFWFISDIILGMLSFGILSTIWFFATIVPSIAVAVRRMHDCDRAGPYCLIPIYGWLILPCTEGTRGPNRFGPDPKAELGQR